MTASSPEWQDHRCHALSPEPSVVEPPALKGLPLIIGTSLATLMVLVLGRQLLAARPEPSPASSTEELQGERRWSLDPERRRLAALLLASRSGEQPRLQMQLLQGQGWGPEPLAPVAIKRQALAAEALGLWAEADRLWQRLQQRFPRAAATADALYALGRHQPGLRERLLSGFPAHPAALAAAIEQATNQAQTPVQRLDGALHLARWGPRWPGAREVLLAQCPSVRGPALRPVRQQLALGLARLGDGGEALTCLAQPASSLDNAADTLTLGTSLLMVANQDPALMAEGRAALISLLRRWPQARETDPALRALAEDPSAAGLKALEELPAPWRDQAPVQARLALAGQVDGPGVLKRWPNDPASWDLRWQLARRALLQRRWEEARRLLDQPPGPGLPAPLAARQRFWLGVCLEKLGQKAAAETLWRDLLQQDGGGYYGWRASVRLGQGTIAPRMTPPQSAALFNRIEQMGWSPLNSAQAQLERLWQAGQGLEAWEVWRHLRRGKSAESGDDLRLEGLLRLGIGDDSQGLEQLERATLRLVDGSCRQRQQLEQGLHPLRFSPAFQQAALSTGLNPALLLGVAKAESQFMPMARSPVGAIGLLQLMPDTARDVAGAPLPDQSLENPETSSRLGALYLSQLLEQWHDDLLATVASYNAGPGAVARWDGSLRQHEPELWVEQIPYPETRLYVKKVLGNAWSYQRGAQLGCTDG